MARLLLTIISGSTDLALMINAKDVATGVWSTVEDVATGVWSTVATAGVSTDYKYQGAAAISSSVYFAPANDNAVGVLDTMTSAFSTIATGRTGMWKYDGAAAVGTR
eukprot:2238333-Prymnesium_polylepis.1